MLFRSRAGLKLLGFQFFDLLTDVAKRAAAEIQADIEVEAPIVKKEDLVGDITNVVDVQSKWCCFW